MSTRSIAAAHAPAPVGGYPQAVEVTGVTRWLYITGQIPEAADGSLPELSPGNAGRPGPISSPGSARRR